MSCVKQENMVYGEDNQIKCEPSEDESERGHITPLPGLQYLSVHACEQEQVDIKEEPPVSGAKEDCNKVENTSCPENDEGEVYDSEENTLLDINRVKEEIDIGPIVLQRSFSCSSSESQDSGELDTHSGCKRIDHADMLLKSLFTSGSPQGGKLDSQSSMANSKYGLSCYNNQYNNEIKAEKEKINLSDNYMSMKEDNLTNTGRNTKMSHHSHFSTLTNNQDQCMKDSFKCEVCGYVATTSSYLKIHIRKHTGEKPHKCHICDYKATWRTELERHLLIHTGEKPHKCNLCDYKATRRDNLKTHLLIHTRGKPHKCHICDYKATRRDNLKTHLLIHTGEKPHKCHICDYKTTHSNSLKAHLLKHTGEKPHKCNLCDYKATDGSNLKRHLLTHTRDRRPHKCHICDYKTTHLCRLKKHLLKHSGEKPHKPT